MKQLGRPKKPESVIIRVPVDRVNVVERLLGYPVAMNQKPHVMVRVPKKDVVKIRKAIK